MLPSYIKLLKKSPKNEQLASFKTLLGEKKLICWNFTLKIFANKQLRMFLFNLNRAKLHTVVPSWSLLNLLNSDEHDCLVWNLFYFHMTLTQHWSGCWTVNQIIIVVTETQQNTNFKLFVFESSAERSPTSSRFVYLKCIFQTEMLYKLTIQC